MAGVEGLDYLLDLDGEEIRYAGGYVARFVVRRVPATSERPHGIMYSLTLHAPGGTRLMGFDNAHRAPRTGRGHGRDREVYDHWHRDEADRGRPYPFQSAAQLVADFFDEVERVLRARDAWPTR
jgi:hypothetical protein